MTNSLYTNGQPIAFVSRFKPEKKEALPREHIMENGLRIITLSTPDVETAQVNAYVNAGSANDPLGYEGTAHYLEHVLGTGSLLHINKKKMYDTIQAWGGYLNEATGNETTEYSSDSVLAEHLDGTVAILLDILQHPRLSPWEIKRERDVINNEIIKGNWDSEVSFGAQFLETFYADTPFAHDPGGDKQSLKKIDEKILRQFWLEHYVPYKTTITIQGPFSDEMLLKMVQKRLTLLGAKKPHTPEPPLPWPKLHLEECLTVVPDVEGVDCDLVWPGFQERLGPQQRESALLKMVVEITNQVLHRELREEGMIYSVSIQAPPDGSPFVLSVSTIDDPGEVIEKIMDILSHMDRYTTDERWAYYKTQARSQIIMQKSVDLALLVALEKLECAQRGVEPIYSRQGELDVLDSITVDEVREMAARIFSQPCGLSLMGQKKLLKQAPSLKEVNEMYTGPRFEGGLQGWAAPLTVTPYDPIVRAVKCRT